MTTLLKEFQPIEAIELPGRYSFAENPEASAKSEYYWSYPLYVHHSLLEADNLTEKLQGYLIEKLQPLSTIRFHQAMLEEGEYTPAYLEYIENWEKGKFVPKDRFGDSEKDLEFVDYHGEVTAVTLEGSSRYSDIQSKITLEDSGNISIAKNKLMISQPESLNGLLSLAVGFSTVQSWRAAIEYKGERSGIIIQTALDYLNQFKKQYNIPLWKLV